MKLLMILLTAAAMNVSAEGFSQHITFSGTNVPLKKVLRSIKDQTGFATFYNEELLERSAPVSMTVKNMPLTEFLNQLFNVQSLQYDIAGKSIFIYRRKPDTQTEAAPVVRILPPVSGVVKDTAGVPLAGVTITIKGSNTSTATDSHGRYELLVKENAVLVFSMVGFEPVELPVNDRSVLNVVLKAKNTSLDDVVVTAFNNKVKRTDMIGSVTTIRPGELKIPSSNLTTALAGRLAGVIAYQRSGEPGLDNADFFIRGVTTFGYKKDPLILIDNMEVDATSLARLQVDDIASFSIMKDATATALYGARGANGVILITTKEGVEGKASISLRLENSISAPTRNVELADPITYMRLHNEAVATRNPEARLPYAEEEIINAKEGNNPLRYPVTDWRKMMMKDRTSNQRANLNISGGGKVARYFVSGAFSQDNGILRVDKRNNFNNNINLKSYSLRSNVNVKVSNTTEMIVRLNGSFDDYTGPIDGGKNIYQMVMNANPVRFPAVYEPAPDQLYIRHPMFGNYDQGQHLNPYAEMVKGYKDYSRSVMGAQLELKQDLSALTKGLNFRVLVNTTRNAYFDVSRQYTPFYYRLSAPDVDGNRKPEVINPDNGSEALTYTEGGKSIQSVFYLESALSYSRTFNKKHTFSGLAIYIMRNALNGNAGTLQQSLAARNVGLSGRGTYAYDNRYYVEFNFGYNGSERFHESKRFGFFPSVGVAWSASNEKFWEPLKTVVNNFRIRGTYGLVGNDAIGAPQDRFFYLSEVNLNNTARSTSFGTDRQYTRSSISVSRYANKEITWETSYKSNIALEFSLFGKLNVIAEYFRDHRKNILMSRADKPTTMGLSTDIMANVGQAISKGVDISADFNHRFDQNWWLQGRANFTYATGKYSVYEEPAYREHWRSRVGKPITQAWGYVAERLFIDDEEVANSPQQFAGARGGDIKYVDLNKDGKITEADMAPIGYPTTPEIIYGFGYSLGYKWFDFSAFFQGSARSSFWISSATSPFVAKADPSTGKTGNRQLLKAYAENHWSEDNRNVYALYPRLSEYEIDNNIKPSTWNMRNGAFLRLKQVELGYTFSRSLSRRVGISKVRIYANASNLFTFSQFRLWDIEMGGDGLGYPVQRVINIGANLTF